MSFNPEFFISAPTAKISTTTWTILEGPPNEQLTTTTVGVFGVFIPATMPPSMGFMVNAYVLTICQWDFLGAPIFYSCVNFCLSKGYWLIILNSE